MSPGKFYEYPLSRLSSVKKQVHMGASYSGGIYGESEVGGTQVLLLSGVPFDKIGLPTLPDDSYAALSEGIQHTLYNKMILPVVALGGLSILIGQRKKKDE